MAVEIPNFFEAGGLFDGKSPVTLSADGNPIVSAEGFQPWDPTTSSGTPKGGFTRIASGNYLLKADRSFDGGEVLVSLTPYIGTAPMPVIGAIVINDGQITVKDVAAVSPPLTSFAFYCAISRIKYGPNATT